MNTNKRFMRYFRIIGFILLYISVFFLTIFEFSWFVSALANMDVQPSNRDFALYFFFVPMRTIVTAIVLLVPNHKVLYNAIVISIFSFIEVLWTTLLFFGTQNYFKNYFGSPIFAASSLAFICNLALLIALCVRLYRIYRNG